MPQLNTVNVATNRLIFGQPHAGTARLFNELAEPGSSTVPIDRFPHYLALKADPQAYLDYLSVSWAHRKPTVKQMSDRFARFLALHKSVETDGVKKPIVVVERPDGRLIVVDGNHRASISHAMGRDVPAHVIDPQAWAHFVTAVEARYGAPNGVPYQDVPGLLGGRRVLDGRHAAIRPEDLTGRVLDMGANLGAATRAASITAEVAVGVDLDPRLVTAALRLGVWFDSAAQFRVANLERDYLEGFDTVLCFAVDSHIRQRTVFNASLLSAKVVYVEANLTRAGRRPEVLDLFRNIEPVTIDPRPMWRCET